MSGKLTCDTSVIVPALLAWHSEHEPARAALAQGVEQVAAHVLIECYSVLTRLPAPHRLAPQAAQDVVGALPWEVCVLPGPQYGPLVRRLASADIRGGAAYDALVAATAAHFDLTLLTRDRRARSTYDVIGARYSLV